MYCLSSGSAVILRSMHVVDCLDRVCFIIATVRLNERLRSHCECIVQVLLNLIEQHNNIFHLDLCDNFTHLGDECKLQI